MRDRLTAALLAFFLGFFGGHKFYLGDKDKGILYLLCGTIGWILIIPGLVVALVSLIEGILLLSMDDKEFNKKYNKKHAEEEEKVADLSRLEKLASLKDKGVITEEEFTAAKKNIKF